MRVNPVRTPAEGRRATRPRWLCLSWNIRSQGLQEAGDAVFLPGGPTQ